MTPRFVPSWDGSRWWVHDTNPDTLNKFSFPRSIKQEVEAEIVKLEAAWRKESAAERMKETNE